MAGLRGEILPEQDVGLHQIRQGRIHETLRVHFWWQLWKSEDWHDGSCDDDPRRQGKLEDNENDNYWLSSVQGTEMCFYLTNAFQNSPPQPTGAGVYLSRKKSMYGYATTMGGYPNFENEAR